MKTIGKRRPANISRWSDFSPNAYCISFVEFVKLTRINVPYLLNAPARRTTWFSLDLYWFIINLVPKALPLEISPLQIC